MEWMQLVERLEFQEEESRQDEVHSKTTVELGAFVEQRQRNLAFVSDAESVKFQAESLLVVCLIQSRPELSMHSHCRTNDATCEIFAKIWMFERIHEITPRENGETQEF